MYVSVYSSMTHMLRNSVRQQLQHACTGVQQHMAALAACMYMCSSVCGTTCSMPAHMFMRSWQHAQHACTCVMWCMLRLAVGTSECAPTACLHMCSSVYGSNCSMPDMCPSVRDTTCSMPAHVFISTWHNMQHARTCVHEVMAARAACLHMCKCIWVHLGVC